MSTMCQTRAKHCSNIPMCWHSQFFFTERDTGQECLFPALLSALEPMCPYYCWPSGLQTAVPPAFLTRGVAGGASDVAHPSRLGDELGREWDGSPVPGTCGQYWERWQRQLSRGTSRAAHCRETGLLLPKAHVSVSRVRMEVNLKADE